MKHIFKITGLILLTLILSAGWYVLRPEAYLPHQKITIAAPFTAQNPPTWIVPMGETINHPDSPLGHPGIDFAWESKGPAKVYASAAGTVQKVKPNTDHPGTFDVELRHGYFYLTRYGGLYGVAPAIIKGANIAQGDWVGTTGGESNGFHWELASISAIRDRFCPLNYFDPVSRKLVEEVWDSTDNHMKRAFPDICSGGYKGREG